MGKRSGKISERQIGFIREQKLFFVATAPPDGRVNCSPKGMDTLKVLSPNEVLWVNLTGSGNETAAHLLEASRMTLLFCAFEGPPLILRLYGSARSYQEGDAFWDAHIHEFSDFKGSRQLIHLQVDLVQASCGFGVPLMDFIGERDMLEPWARELGPEGLAAYRMKKNRLSLDGRDTGLREGDTGRSE